MRILAIECSTRSGSVALWETGPSETGPSETGPLLQTTLPSSPRTAQTLIPAIDDLLQRAGCQADDVELVATTIGPGSFTGLRLGLTTARTFAYAVHAELLGIGTLRLLAYQLAVHDSQTDSGQEHPSPRQIEAVLDAHRGQVFRQRFQTGDGDRPDDPAAIGTTQRHSAAVQELGPVSVVDIPIWVDLLNSPIVVTGDGLRRVAEQLSSSVPRAPEKCWTPQADALAALAWHDYQAGCRHDLWKLQLQYHRRSAAEEKADASP